MSAFRRPGESGTTPNTTSPAKPAPELPAKETPTRNDKRTSVQRPASRTGGLTGQYSSSVPTEGAYFPDMNEPTDEAEILRQERLREKEQKRLALKAAWGVDTRKSRAAPRAGQT